MKKILILALYCQFKFNSPGATVRAPDAAHGLFVVLSNTFGSFLGGFSSDNPMVGVVVLIFELSSGTSDESLMFSLG